MVINPLFAPEDEEDKRASNDASYVLPNRHGRKIQPLHSDLQTSSVHPAHPAAHVTPAQASGSVTSADTPLSAMVTGEPSAAVELIRRKLETLYAQEPDAEQEALTIVNATPKAQVHRSSHQQFMHDLSTSGKSLADIQTAWHEYYISLPDDEKHAVWQEFYSANEQRPSSYSQFVTRQPEVAQAHIATDPAPAAPQMQLPSFPARRSGSYVRPGAKKKAPVQPENRVVVAEHVPSERPTKVENKQVAAIKRQIKKRVKLNAATQTKAKQHVKSLLFGLGTGSLVIIIVLFGLFNEVIITPFIQPSRHASATPIILDTSGVAPTPNPEVIIPKIGVEIPVDYTLTTTDENAIENNLEDGTVHYASTSKPGEKGNVAIFGHSSNNIFNPGKYKFAFVLLHTLVPGDIFYLTYNDKVYSYQVYNTEIVSPSDVAVLNPVAGKTATATLITCDPPGTSLNRLVVSAAQISPDPNGNANATNVPTATTPAGLAGNGPSLWKRLTGWL